MYWDEEKAVWEKKTKTFWPLRIFLRVKYEYKNFKLFCNWVHVDSDPITNHAALLVCPLSTKTSKWGYVCCCRKLKTLSKLEGVSERICSHSVCLVGLSGLFRRILTLMLRLQLTTEFTCLSLTFWYLDAAWSCTTTEDGKSLVDWEWFCSVFHLLRKWFKLYSSDLSFYRALGFWNKSFTQ